MVDAEKTSEQLNETTATTAIKPADRGVNSNEMDRENIVLSVVKSSLSKCLSKSFQIFPLEISI